VILKDQADVRPTTAIADRDARMKAVYDTLTAQANRTQAPLRRTLTQLGIAHTPYYLVNAIEVDGGLPMKAFLLAQPEVARVIVRVCVRCPNPRRPRAATNRPR
jgi:hypothetical protein